MCFKGWLPSSRSLKSHPMYQLHVHALTHAACAAQWTDPGRVVYIHGVDLAWLGSWKAVGRALFDTERSPVRMQTTASVPMCCVLWNSWLAATDRTASSLGMPLMEPAAAASWRHTGQDIGQAQNIHHSAA